MQLGALTRPELVFVDVPGSDQARVLRALADRVVAASEVDDADLLYRRLAEREDLGSTAIGSDAAIPHCKMRRIEHVIVAVGISRQGVEYNTSDGQPVKLLFVVISPESDPTAHLQSLSAIARWVQADHHVERILELDTPEEIYELLQRESD